MMAAQIRQKYLDFFTSRGHTIVPSSPLVPENDPTTLFTGSGMQPMIPYLLGEPYPHNLTRIVDSQKCFRTQDIDEIGNNRHTTLFEMLGNWSLGDYFKEEQLAWFWEFLTVGLRLPAGRLYVSLFEGDDQIPRDDEAAQIWQKLGVAKERIFYYDETKNWWSRAGVKADMPVGEPGGPDSEVFFEFTQVDHDPKFGKKCHPNCNCGRFLEIGNSVFMTFKKTPQGFVPLEKKNIDFGGGLERIAATVNDDPDIFTTSLFTQIISTIEDFSDKKYMDENNQSPMRIIADHLKAATFLVVDGVRPDNKAQGYFLRRVLRRAAVKMHQLKGGLTPVPGFQAICRSVMKIYEDTSYFDYNKDSQIVDGVIDDEMGKFAKTLDKGLKEVGKVSPFDLLQTYGFPPEITEELLKQQGEKLDWGEFERQKQAHQNLSRTSSKGMFKGGLQDQSEITTKYHTATHLLHAALRQVLGTGVQQKGSNITADRLRFDFSHPKKLNEKEIKLVEQLVNEKISENIKVERLEMDKNKALAMGALAFFPEKYPQVTSVYKIADFSLELCGGPHVDSTGQMGKFKIVKEESAGAGVRRVYAKVE